MTFSFTVSNESGSDLAGVVLGALTPDHIFVTDVSDGGSCGGFGCASGEEATWSLDVLRAGQTRTVRLTGEVVEFSDPPPDGTFIRTTANVIAEGVTEASGQAAVVTQGNPVLTLAFIPGLTPIEPGEASTYTLRFSNRADVTALDVLLEVDIPSESTFISASDSGAYREGQVVWALGDLGPAIVGQRILTIDTDFAASSGSLLTARAHAHSAIRPDYSADGASVVTLTRDSLLGLSIGAFPDPVAPGEQVTFSFTVSNESGSDLAGVVLGALTPDHIFVTDVSDGGSCGGFGCASGEEATWSLDVLRAGQTRTVRLTGEVVEFSDPPPYGTFIRTTANVIAEGVTEAIAQAAVAVNEN